MASSSSASILDRLKPPQKSDLARKRKIERPKTTGADKKRKSGASNLTDPKTVSPADRVKQFPGECLEVKHGKLFCVACREELSLKKSTVKNHLYSGNKHQDAKDRLAKRKPESVISLIAWWRMTRQNSPLVRQCRWQRGCIESRWLRTS